MIQQDDTFALSGHCQDRNAKKAVCCLWFGNACFCCTFSGHLALALMDLGTDMKMLKKKISKMVKMGKKVAEAMDCFKCHGPEGKGIGKAPAWTYPGFAKKMDSKVTIKKTIIKRKRPHAL